MKRIALTLALALAAAGAFAQHGHYGAASQHIAQAPAKDLADGEVRKIDKAVGKVTITHGEIKAAACRWTAQPSRSRRPAAAT